MTHDDASFLARLGSFVRALVLLAAVTVAVPWVLIAAARARFGGGGPLHGVPSPADWELDRIVGALRDRLSEDTIADIVIRVSLLVIWAAIAVLVLTVVVEVVHMVRHDGLPMPEVRGLGWSQSGARLIAAGLLVVVPMWNPGRTAADGAQLVPMQRGDAVPAATARPENVWVVDDVAAAAVRDAVDDVLGAAPDVTTAASTPGAEQLPAPEVATPAADAAAGVPAVGGAAATASLPGRYVVRSGDSIYAIAERVAGVDAAPDFAEQMLDLNLGRRMPDGQRFTNAAYIEVGWELELPPIASTMPAASTSSAAAPSGRHVVERGETLWSIAEDELGEPERWPEIYDANRDRTFDDGERLDDPDLILPGWQLDLPGDAPDPEAAPTDRAAAPVADATEDAIVASVDPAPPATRGLAETLPVDPVAHVADPEPTAEPRAALPENRWAPPPPAATVTVGRTTSPPVAAESPGDVADTDDRTDDRSDDPGDGLGLAAPAAAAMLASGVLGLVAARRRRRLRAAAVRERLPRPDARSAATERRLRAVEATRSLVAIRACSSTATSIARQGGRPLALLVDDDGEVELHVSIPVELPPPWCAGVDGTVWHRSAEVGPITDPTPSTNPVPTLVQLGRTRDGRDVFVDLEAVEAVEVGGPSADADAVVRAVGATLAASPAAELATLVTVGVDPSATLGRVRAVSAHDGAGAIRAAIDAIGSTARAGRSTFDLRVLGSGGEPWEPAVVLVGSGGTAMTVPDVRTGLAVVSARPLVGSSADLVPDGDAWLLHPLGIRFVPVGLSEADCEDLAALVAGADADPVVEVGPILDIAAHRPVVADDLTLAPPVESEVPADASEPVASVTAWAICVRLLGPVAVESVDGRRAEFDRSKAIELIAWLATHRDRSTRSAARTALWEVGVQNATLNNVVSEARRTLARLVEPPTGDEWVGRTMTDALPLHAAVRTDADLLAEALDRSRSLEAAPAIGILAPAVARIAGLPFEGCDYLWPDAEGLTSSLVVLATSASAALAERYLEVGDLRGVLDATGRGLRVLPGHEELIALRLRAHASGGDTAGVRSEWEQYERALTSDPWSDGEPAPRLVELRRTLLSS